ncbi:MAG: hypothetical protein VYA32_01930, partial [Planctomycetota bacterium]|nr:hypothetical protein [Planctomycetota bacterium]
MTASNAVLPDTLIEEILGYVNLSSGTHDPAFARNINQLCDHLGGLGCWKDVGETLVASLESLSPRSPALADDRQATTVLELVFDGLIPLYRLHHQDLLHHLDDDDWEQPLLLVMMFEAVLECGPDYDSIETVLDTALDTLNDFLGYRPVAVLENDQ